ncbi:hypothetical protein I7I48_05930 [Histoplasma ohiense]|nr:hypothetical protein I7I48_05930 [Histoplasma ohiense (nom. inval.)]
MSMKTEHPATTCNAFNMPSGNGLSSRMEMKQSRIPPVLTVCAGHKTIFFHRASGKQNLFEFQPLRETIASTFRKLAPESRAGTHWPSQVPPYIPRCLRSYTIESHTKFMVPDRDKLYLLGAFVQEPPVDRLEFALCFAKSGLHFVLRSSTVVGGPTFHEYLEKAMAQGSTCILISQ